MNAKTLVLILLSAVSAIAVPIAASGAASQKAVRVATAHGVARSRASAPSGTFETIYSFTGGPAQCSYPTGITAMNGALYGTASQGPLLGYPYYTYTTGCIWGLTSSGAEQVLQNFIGYSQPNGDPIGVDGVLYGSSVIGGGTLSQGQQYGFIFGVGPGRVQPIIYDFWGSTASGYPNAPLIYANGALYGTANFSSFFKSNNVAASVYSVGLNGKLLFKINFPAGIAPIGSLAEINGTIYGATRGGGTYGSGFVFAIDSSNTIRTVVAFPYNMVASSGLIAARGKLYGAASSSNNGGGIFEVGTTGWFAWLHQFNTIGDGSNPAVNPVYVNGNFYGTTVGGGDGFGTIYEINPNGGEKILHYFEPYTIDGVYPNSDLVELNGILYGTTNNGGSNSFGSIFSIVP